MTKPIDSLRACSLLVLVAAGSGCGILDINGDVDAICGNGVVETGEACDSGEQAVAGCSYGASQCALCSPACDSVVLLQGRYCGDGVVDPEEVCDDGNVINESECPYGTPMCVLCSSACDMVLSLAGRYCGDAVVDPEEVCDDGNAANGDGCSSTCEVQAGWACDTEQPNRCALESMVIINSAGQTFTIGSPETEPNHSSRETQHEVTFTHDFALSPTELTELEFASLMNTWNPGREWPSDNFPVGQVSWYDAVAYVNELTKSHGGAPCYELTDVLCEDLTEVGADYMSCMNTTQGGIESATVGLSGVTSVYDCSGFRLPTEAEWEYAARAGTTTATYNGDLNPAQLECEEPNSTLDPIAWFCGNAELGPHDVGLSGRDNPANAFGLYDMLGNVWEWCWDWTSAYSAEPVTDPAGPDTVVPGTSRIFRGGSWRDYAMHTRAAGRGDGPPGLRMDNLGLRVARSLP